MTDTAAYLHDALAAGKRILAEGAQGALLDVDHGTYPFVTSSSPTAGGACTGPRHPADGRRPRHRHRQGLLDARRQRPLPDRAEDATGERLRAIGGEFGATTGRPRRCGWLDLVALRYAARLNGFTEIALTKLDVLAGFDEIRVCTAYRIDGKTTDRYPADARVLERASPVCETLPGFAGDLAAARTFADLPDGRAPTSPTSRSASACP